MRGLKEEAGFSRPTPLSFDGVLQSLVSRWLFPSSRIHCGEAELQVQGLWSNGGPREVPGEWQGLGKVAPLPHLLLSTACSRLVRGSGRGWSQEDWG